MHNQERISLSGVQPKYSMVVRDGRLRLTEEGEQGRYILKPKLSDFRNRLYSAANENLTMQIAAQVFGIETARTDCASSKAAKRLHRKNVSTSSRTVRNAAKRISRRWQD